MTESSIVIEGMSCMHCVMRVKKAIEALPGVTSLNVEIGKATVGFDEGQTSLKDIETVIAKAGYRVKD